MKKLLLVLIITINFLLLGCQASTKVIREEVYQIFSQQEELIKNKQYYSIEEGNEVRLGGFASYSVLHLHKSFSLYLTRKNVYSEVNFVWNFDGNDLHIESMEIIYLDIGNNVYLQSFCKPNQAYIYSIDSYNQFVIDLSRMRINDIRWILKSMDFDLSEVE